MPKTIKTLNEIKRDNILAGRHFFDKGNPPVVSKKGHYLITKASSSEGFVVYKYDEKTGYINFVDNPKGKYTWQPYKTKAEAVRYTTKLSKKD